MRAVAFFLLALQAVALYAAEPRAGEFPDAWALEAALEKATTGIDVQTRRSYAKDFLPIIPYKYTARLPGIESVRQYQLNHFFKQSSKFFRAYPSVNYDGTVRCLEIKESADGARTKFDLNVGIEIPDSNNLQNSKCFYFYIYMPYHVFEEELWSAAAGGESPVVRHKVMDKDLAPLYCMDFEFEAERIQSDGLEPLRLRGLERDKCKRDSTSARSPNARGGYWTKAAVGQSGKQLLIMILQGDSDDWPRRQREPVNVRGPTPPLGPATTIVPAAPSMPSVTPRNGDAAQAAKIIAEAEKAKDEAAKITAEAEKAKDEAEKITAEAEKIMAAALAAQAAASGAAPSESAPRSVEFKLQAGLVPHQVRITHGGDKSAVYPLIEDSRDKVRAGEPGFFRVSADKDNEWAVRLRPADLQLNEPRLEVTLSESNQEEPEWTCRSAPVVVRAGPLQGDAVDVACEKRKWQTTLTIDARITPSVADPERFPTAQIAPGTCPGADAGATPLPRQKAYCISGYDWKASDFRLKFDVEGAPVLMIDDEPFTPTYAQRFNGVAQHFGPQGKPHPRLLKITLKGGRDDQFDIAKFALEPFQDEKVVQVKEGSWTLNKRVLEAEIVFNKALVTTWLNSNNIRLILSASSKELVFRKGGDKKSQIHLVYKLSDTTFEEDLEIWEDELGFPKQLSVSGRLGGSEVPVFYCEIGVRVGEHDIVWFEVPQGTGPINLRSKIGADIEQVKYSAPVLFYARALQDWPPKRESLKLQSGACLPEDVPFLETSVGRLNEQPSITMPFAPPVFIYFLRSEATDRYYLAESERVYERWLRAVVDLRANRLVVLRQPAVGGFETHYWEPRDAVLLVNEHNVDGAVGKSRSPNPPDLRAVVQDATALAKQYGVLPQFERDVIILHHGENELFCNSLNAKLRTDEGRILVLNDFSSSQRLVSTDLDGGSQDWVIEECPELPFTIVQTDTRSHIGRERVHVDFTKALKPFVDQFMEVGRSP